MSDTTQRARCDARETAEETQRLLSARADRLRALGQLAAGIAHELNQPLVGVRGLAEHILIGMARGWNLSDEKMREKLSLIIAQADRMTHIIQRVRTFASDVGKPQTSLMRVNEVVQGTMSMLVPQHRVRGIELDCELAEGNPMVQANPMSLEGWRSSFHPRSRLVRRQFLPPRANPSQRIGVLPDPTLRKRGFHGNVS